MSTKFCSKRHNVPSNVAPCLAGAVVTPLKGGREKGREGKNEEREKKAVMAGRLGDKEGGQSPRKVNTVGRKKIGGKEERRGVEAWRE